MLHSLDLLAGVMKMTTILSDAMLRLTKPQAGRNLDN
jgi:hypothetical protein